MIGGRLRSLTLPAATRKEKAALDEHQKAAEDDLRAAVAGAKTSQMVAEAEDDRRRKEAEAAGGAKGLGGNGSGRRPPEVKNAVNGAAVLGTDAATKALVVALSGVKDPRTAAMEKPLAVA